MMRGYHYAEFIKVVPVGTSLDVSYRMSDACELTALTSSRERRY
jgi:hypothetical protein